MRTLRQSLAGNDAPALIRAGSLGNQITFDGGVIRWRKADYPATGAKAEVNDFRSGLGGRRHTTEMTITLATGRVLAWHQDAAGTMARVTRNQATAFAAAVNSL